MGRTSGQVLGRQSSIDHVSKRWAEFDRDTLNQVNRLLYGQLPDAELPALSKKIGDIIDQLSVSSPQRNALAALFNYTKAQGSIALGYNEDILTPKTLGGDSIPAIGWLLWSTPSIGPLTWGIDFVKRIQYVSSQGGDITFILPEGEYGHTFTAQGAFTSYCIWKEVLSQIDAMAPSPDYQFMLFGVVPLEILLKMNNRDDYKNLYAYHVFRQAYEACNKPDSPIADTPIDKPTISAHVQGAIKALAGKDLPTDNQLGGTTYFEFVYLLYEGTNFEIVGTEEKIRKFADFLTDEQDPDQREFHNKIRELTALAT
jgi:hypothetical protein